MRSALQDLYPEMAAGGFTRVDGNIEVYGRINALLRPDMTILDLGAGRGRQNETSSRLSQELLNFKGKVARVCGLDVDPAVMANPTLDEARTYDGTTIPYEDATFDLVFSDWVLEHIEDPATFAREVGRVLKPGGWFCARTPNTLSIVAIGSRMVPNRYHAKVLQHVQKGKRKEEDVFPTRYRLNSQRAVRRYFPAAEWLDCSYGYSAEPSYHFNNTLVARLMAAAQYIKRPLAPENLFIFVQKR